MFLQGSFCRELRLYFYMEVCVKNYTSRFCREVCVENCASRFCRGICIENYASRFCRELCVYYASRFCSEVCVENYASNQEATLELGQFIHRNLHATELWSQFISCSVSTKDIVNVFIRGRKVLSAIGEILYALEIEISLRGSCCLNQAVPKVNLISPENGIDNSLTRNTICFSCREKSSKSIPDHILSFLFQTNLKIIVGDSRQTLDFSYRNISGISFRCFSPSKQRETLIFKREGHTQDIPCFVWSFRSFPASPGDCISIFLENVFFIFPPRVMG